MQKHEGPQEPRHRNEANRTTRMLVLAIIVLLGLIVGQLVKRMM